MRAWTRYGSLGRSRRQLYRRTRYLAALSVTGLIGSLLIPVTAWASQPSGRAAASRSVAANRAALATRVTAVQRAPRRLPQVPHGDEIVTARGDANGWHVFAASSGAGWRWQPLATLLPGGYSDEGWIGQQCLTGDGRYVVAVVAPWHAQNYAVGMNSGAVAYVIDAHSGVARPLAADVSLAYFDPGCGTGSLVALTRFAGRDAQSTQILIANAATGAVVATKRVPGQVTSAVPAGRRLYAALGGWLVRVNGGRVVPVAHADGQIFALRPNDLGGVDYLSARPGARTALVWRQSPGSVRRIGSGPLRRIRLFGGRDGRNIVVGASRLSPGSGLRVIAAPSSVPVDGASLDGNVTASPPTGRPGARNRLVMTEALRVAGTMRVVADKLPASRTPVTIAEPAAPRAATGREARAKEARRHGGSGQVMRAASTSGSGPCAVPRSSTAIQVPQPTADEVRWAVNQAVAGGLTGVNARPAGFDNLGLTGYSPSADFPIPALTGGGRIPREVLEGIFAQESNFDQASWHAIPGVAGDPLIADYYGYNSTGTIDYSQADCGYGIGQLTDIMTQAATPTVGLANQEKVAVDFAENTAAAAQALAAKWNEVTAAGITAGGAASILEDWYFAIWDYNSGLEPNAAHGNTTGCRPSPTCTDAWGNWGLGWANNPVNPDYDPQRHPFLHTFDSSGNPVMTYGDAATPQDWPYQEKVFGWMETAQFGPSGTQDYQGTFDWNSGLGFFLTLPASAGLCDSSNNCNPSDPSGQYCQLNPTNGTPSGEQYHCWLHHGDNFCATASTPCHPSGPEAGVPATDPGSVDPFPPVCDPDPTQLPSNAIIVASSHSQANLAGCPNPPTSWTNQGTFTTRMGGLAQVDWHQLGVGFGGHNWFTHSIAAGSADASDWTVTGFWSPPRLSPGRYDIEAFIPTDDASAIADYQINSGYGPSWSSPIDQNQFGNQWADLGAYWLGPNGDLSLSNIDANPSDGRAGEDLAYDAVAFIPDPGGSYVALGDSYSSGEGAGPYDQPSNTSTDQCHRSANAYPRVFFSTNHPAGQIVDVACSGAVIKNILTTALGGQTEQTEKPQLDQVPTDSSVVTITIGGNDAGFGPVLKSCITGNGCETYYTQNDANNEDVVIAKLKPQLVNLYQAIRAANPTALVVVLTYPNIFKPTTSGTGCGGLSKLTPHDIEWLIAEANNLDNTIMTAAQQAGVLALDERYAFAGHELCTSVPWVNGPGLTSDAMHPTAAGYGQMAKDLASSLANPGQYFTTYTNLRSPRPGTPNTATALNLLHLMPSGVSSYYTGTGFARSFFGGWDTQRAVLTGYTGCGTDQLVYQRDNDQPGYVKTGCNPVGGTWYTPYDALADPNIPITWGPTYNPNGTNLYALRVDHVIPLRDAWANGARNWTDPELPSDFANDWRGLELLTTSNTTNSSKQDSSIEQWQPPNTTYWCTYAKMWVAIKYDWNIPIDGTLIQAPATTDEWDWLNNELASC